MSISESSNVSSKSRYEVPSVRRSGKILLAMAASENAVGISELSQLLSLPKATVYRIMQTLELDGFVERVDGDRYTIGYSAFEVGRAYIKRLDLQSAFTRVSHQLVADHNETVQLAILVGTDVLYIAKEDSSQAVRLASNVGSRLPASATSLGKAMMAYLPDDQVRALYPHGHLVQMTPNSHESLTSLLADLIVIRERGWAHDNEEVAIGLQCVASAILDQHQNPVAAISMAVPTHRITEERLAHLGESVKQAALDIGTLLGYVE